MAEKKYFRQVSSGNISIEGTDANGITLTNGNTYIYSGDNPLIDDPNQTPDPNKKVQPADPNNTLSYIAITKEGTINVNIGNTNQQSLNIQNNNDIVNTNNIPQKPGKAIIIGDSQTESIKANSKLLEPIGPQGVLWKVGWNLKNLNEAIKKYIGNQEVVKVFINIGTNDGYQETTSIKDFIDVVKEKFPSATNGLYVFGGSYGWGNLKNTKVDTLTPYYKKFTDVGVFKLKNDIGYSSNHPNDKTPGIVAVGKEIDEIISSTLVPAVIKQQTQQKTTIEKTNIKESTIIELEEENLYDDEFNNLPIEEQPTQLYDIITPTDPGVLTIDYTNPTIYSKYFVTRIKGQTIKRERVSKVNKKATLTKNYTLDGDRISPDQCQFYFGDKTPYIPQYNNWGCLVTSITMIAQASDVNITQEMFYNKPSYKRIPPYILDGNNLNFRKLKEDFPSLIRENDPTKKTTVQIFEAYKDRLIKIQRPIVIRIRGTTNFSRGHYVTAVGITIDGNIIIHNPSSQKIAFSDQVINSTVCLGTDQPSDNGRNYDIIYIS